MSRKNIVKGHEEVPGNCAVSQCKLQCLAACMEPAAGDMTALSIVRAAPGGGGSGADAATRGGRRGRERLYRSGSGGCESWAVVS